MAEIGPRLKRARELRVMTQAELSQRSGVPIVTISRIENGHVRSRPFPGTIRRLADALGVNASWLMLGVGDAKSLAPSDEIDTEKGTE